MNLSNGSVKLFTLGCRASPKGDLAFPRLALCRRFPKIVSGCPEAGQSRAQNVYRGLDGTDGKAENKRIFDTLHSRKAEIEQSFGSALSWERLDEKRGCREIRGPDACSYRSVTTFESAVNLR